MLDKVRILKWLERFRDVRRAGLAVFVVIVLLVTWSGIKAVQSNYKLEKQVAVLKQQNAVQQLKDQNLKLQNDYYNSNQYLELSARQNFGLAAPGETELIVPQNVAMSYVKDLPSNNSSSTAKPSQPPFFIRNLENWWNFFRGRQTS